MTRSSRFLNGIVILTMAALACATLVCALRPITYSELHSELAVAVRPSGVRTDVTDSTQPEPGWPNLFGPTLNSVSEEGAIVTACPAEGPAVFWRASIGEGYSSPIALGDDVIVFHRPWLDGGVADQQHGPSETITCLDMATGQRRWEYMHPTSFLCRTH